MTGRQTGTPGSTRNDRNRARYTREYKKWQEGSMVKQGVQEMTGREPGTPGSTRDDRKESGIPGSTRGDRKGAW